MGEVDGEQWGSNGERQDTLETENDSPHSHSQGERNKIRQAGHGEECDGIGSSC